MLYLFPNFHKSFQMMRLSIITPIDHQLKGTNLHKILVLYHLQLRRALRPWCRTNILMRGNHRTAHHTRITLSTNILIFQCHHHSFSPSHPPGINPFKYLLFGLKSGQSLSILALAIGSQDLCHSLTSFIFTVILLSIVVGSLSSEIFYMSNNSLDLTLNQ